MSLILRVEPNETEVTEFINKRLRTTGNSYHFVTILKGRFPKGEVFYDTVGERFLFKWNGKYYDRKGVFVPDKEEAIVKVAEWNKYKESAEDVVKRSEETGLWD